MQMPPTFDVAIVGYGPVGGMAALSLAHAGLSVLILERSTEETNLPRAVGLDGETLRGFQRLGFGDEIAAICQPPRDPNEICFANSKREVLFGVEMPPFGRNGWCDMSFFDQPELEAAIRRLVAKEGRIEVHLGERVVALDQDDEAVTLATAAANVAHATTYQARYVVGCDGASSFVRGAIGAKWESLDYDQDWLVLDIVAGPDADLPESVLQICDPSRLTSYIAVKDPNRRWEFQLLEDEAPAEMTRPEKVRELLADWLAPEHYEIRRAAVYQFHAAMASTWRVGRVFLAGDAAHQTPPFLGQGLNAGMRDAINLGWKLPLVLRGVAEATLLDTYEEERDPHARELVDRAVGVGKLMETIAAREAGLPDPHPPESIQADPGEPAVPPLRTGFFSKAQIGVESRVGQLFRQPIVRVRDGDAREFRLDELLGDGFAVVGRRAGSLPIADETQGILDRLGARVVSVEGLELVRGDWDSALDRCEAVLIRPDRYVFGLGESRDALDQLIAEWSAI